MRTYDLNMDQNDIAILSEALGNVVFKIAAPLVQKLQMQINAQDQARDAPKGDNVIDMPIDKPA